MRALAIAVRLRAQLTGRKPRPRRPKVPLARWPHNARATYLNGMLEMIGTVERLWLLEVDPLLPLLLASHAATRPDAADQRLDMTGTLTEDVVNRVRAAAEAAVPERQIQLLATESAVRVSNHTRTELERQVNAVAKVQLFDDSAGLAPHIDAFVSDNVRLVRSVTFDQLEDLKGIILRHARQGLRVEALRDEIRERFEISKRRAARIARDQVGSLNSELAQLRQRSAGVRRYTWSTSKDGRVRKGHRKLEGTVQSYAKPPIVHERSGKRAHPGEDVECRCQAIPVIDDILADAGLLDPADVDASLGLVASR
jgi:SPP1 gp7 family putative phage head morphogenesis protein